MVSEAKRKRLSARPKKTPVVCLNKEKSSALNLASRLNAEGLSGGSLYLAGGLCLGLIVETAELKRLLPTICEHSDAVCLGSDYPEIFSEHGRVLIRRGALEKLSSKRFYRRGHIF